jgi:flagellar motor protein MotB
MYPVFTDPSEEGLESKNAKTEEAQDKSYNSRSDDNKADSNGYPEHLSADKNIAYIESKGSEPDRDKKEQASDVQHAADVSKNNDEQTNSGPVKDHGNAILKALEDEIMSGLIDLEVKKEQIIIRIREKASFPSGSADLIEPFKAITGRISDVFKDFDGLIIVSGHTDNVPIHTDRFRSNWELSSSRAVSVILELSKNKLLSNKRFKLAAYADTQPVDTNDTAKGRAKNRRVEITLDYSSLSDDMKEAASAILKNGADNEDGTTNSRPMPGDHAGVVAR